MPPASREGDFEQRDRLDGGRWLLRGRRSSVVPARSAVKRYLSSGVALPDTFNRLGRGYPDLSLVSHNCPVVEGADVVAIDGTSCSAPLWAGLVGLLNMRRLGVGKPVLGFMNPLLYWAKQTFNDIEEGNNWSTESAQCPERGSGSGAGSIFGYQAAAGWDAVTGLGTPNIGLLQSLIGTVPLPQEEFRALA